MNTVCHGAWAYLATNRTKKFKWYFMIGSLLPDTAIIATGVFETFKGQFHIFSDWLPQLFANSWMDPVNNTWHSIPIWSVLLLLTVIFRLQKIRWLIYGVYLHLLIDIFTHRHFVPAYFFPLSTVKLKGVVDYHWPSFFIVDIVVLVLLYLYYFWTRFWRERLKV